MQIKLVFLTICASLAAVGFAAPAPFLGPMIRIGSKVLPKAIRGKVTQSNQSIIKHQ